MKKRNLPLKIAAMCFILSFGSTDAQDFKSIIKSHISSKTDFVKRNLDNFEIINEDFSKSMGGDVVKIQQYYNGIPVFNSFGTAIIKHKKVTYLQESFVKNFSNDTSASTAKLGRSLFENVAQNLGLKNVEQYAVVGFNENHSAASENVQNRQCYFLTENNDLKLAYEFVFQEKGTANYWDIVADANTGKILSKQNLTLSCNFNHDAFGHDYAAHLPEGFNKIIGAEENLTANKALAPQNASYRVFALPVESPNHGNRTLVSNPWFTDASPDGWHKIGGGDFAGNFTNTRGNNVYAYEDTADTNFAGSSPDGGANLIFDFPIVSQPVANNLPASTTNLFYINNKVHDIFYRLGFVETARNFQAYNYLRGGLGADYVNAESQDGGGTNNANFSTPPDGSMPRMQMYLWDPAIVDRVFYNAPPEAVGRKVKNGRAIFGPQLSATGVTEDVKLSPVLNACTPMAFGTLRNKIGLIERGGCDFVTKVKNAQDAGAVAAIIYSLPGSAVGNMGGDDPTILIPSVLIENAEGEYIKSLLASNKNVNITLKYDAANQASVDGSFDNGIVIHEYGHGISNRNTGNGYSCLNKNVSAEQMGEGWSDFFALMLTNRPGETAATARGIGTYASSQDIYGLGIRPTRYSPDFSVNNYMYANTKTMQTTDTSGVVVPNVHAIGYVWATMLWDLHWRYVEKYGYSSDVMANTTNGSTRVLQLVTDALKLQPCNPTFIEGRDAILQADQNTTGGADRCMIWNVFARRGLGVNASAGVKSDITDQIQDTAIPSDCDKLATNESESSSAFSIYPNPAKGEFFLKSPKSILGKVNVTIFDASGKLVANQKISPSESVNTQVLPNGVYVVKVEGLGVNYSTKLMIRK